MPDDTFLVPTRDSYDLLAAEFPDAVRTDLDGKPLDRALLRTFAELVPAGPVADVGCGPGHLTALLHRLGLDAFGVDLSPGMVALARRTHPGVRFEVGSMLALDIADGSLGGLLAHYSIIHVPWERRPAVFAEFRRVLAPGGAVMLAFQVGDDRGHRDEAYGRPICLDWYRQQPDDIATLLVDAGFEVWAHAVRQPDRTALEGVRPDRIVGLGVAHVPEGRQVLARMTVLDNLRAGAFARRDGGVEADLLTLLARFPELGARRAQVAGTLSGGEQQMLAIARGLMTRPALLMLDEPSLGLAPRIVERIFAIITEVNDGGTPILLVEQNAQLALETADQGYVLETGRVVHHDRADRLLGDAAVRRAYLG